MTLKLIVDNTTDRPDGRDCARYAGRLRLAVFIGRACDRRRIAGSCRRRPPLGSEQRRSDTAARRQQRAEQLEIGRQADRIHVIALDDRLARRQPLLALRVRMRWLFPSGQAS